VQITTLSDNCAAATSCKKKKKKKKVKENTRVHRKVALIPCEKSIGPLILSKDALRGGSWLIKCPCEGNLNDVEHFNTPPHVWQLMTKHVKNNGREKPTVARNL
jgi:hypothetical protein